MNVYPFEEAIKFYLDLGGFEDVIELMKTTNYLNKKPNL
jgi:hypothetical protein